MADRPALRGAVHAAASGQTAYQCVPADPAIGYASGRLIRAEVFAVLTDPERTPSWSASVQEERWVTPPHGLGSRRIAVTRSLGRRMENVAEVTAFEPGRGWTLRSVRGPAFESSARFSEVPDGTRVEWTWEFGGPTGVMIRLFAPIFRRRFAADLGTLKRMMEQGDL